jgi:hypothetical protein
MTLPNWKREPRASTKPGRSIQLRVELVEERLAPSPTLPLPPPLVSSQAAHFQPPDPCTPSGAQLQPPDPCGPATHYQPPDPC